jgi:uncharacterized membrane protein YkvA (DUF1232 family)
MLIAKDFPLSAGTIALIVGTLAYFISPVDLVPDTIAVFGYLDDALLVAEVGALLAADVARFRARDLSASQASLATLLSQELVVSARAEPACATPVAFSLDGRPRSGKCFVHKI